MADTWIKQLFLFFLLVFLQVWLFDKIHLLGFATPLLYIYFIIKLPVETNRNVVLVLSALIGLTIDLFSTLGVNMLATTIVGFSRSGFLKLFAPRDVFESCSPSFSTFGRGMFLRYAFLMTLLHQIILFSIESFSMFDPLRLVLCISGSFTLTMLLIFAFESFNIGNLKT
jgi:rod shape-determining protein MreD